MQKNAIVKNLEVPNDKKKNIVIVEPLSSLECASCNHNCKKRHSFILAVNNKNFPLKINSIVKISTSKKQELFETIVSLSIPIFMAFLGFMLSNPIYRTIIRLIKKDGTLNAVCPEGTKAFIVIIFFSLAVLFVLILTRSKAFLIYPEITDVLEPEH